MPLYKNDKRFPQEEMPIGVWRNGITYNLSATSATTIATMGSAGSTDNTRFSIFYVPCSGVFTVEYNLITYTDGTIQEAIFKYDNLGQLGNQVINQNWATPAIGLRQITGCTMDCGIYVICLRNGSSTNTISVGGLTTSIGSATTIDFGMYINVYKLNTATSQTLYGNFSDFSPYVNYTKINKYLFPDYINSYGIYKIRIKRTA